jgi:tetratricopeptide (TPR) repeat protein
MHKPGRLPGAAALVLVFYSSGCRAGREPTPAGPSVKELVSEARRLDLAGQQDDAIARYQEALRQAPESFDAHYGLARALDLAGRYDEARDHFARAIALAPESDKEQTLRMMGIARTFAGRIDEASRYFKDVFDRRVAAANFAAAAEEANELGRVYLENGDLDLAETWYRTGHEVAAKTSDRQPWQVDLADMRWAHAQARIAARRGRVEEARRHVASVKRLLDKGGNDEQRIQYPYLVGYVEFSLGNDQPAVAALSQADQTDPFVLGLLGQAHERLGHAAEAEAYYRKVLQSSSHAVNSAFARPIARRKLEAPVVTTR